MSWKLNLKKPRIVAPGDSYLSRLVQLKERHRSGAMYLCMSVDLAFWSSLWNTHNEEFLKHVSADDLKRHQRLLLARVVPYNQSVEAFCILDVSKAVSESRFSIVRYVGEQRGKDAFIADVCKLLGSSLPGLKLQTEGGLAPGAFPESTSN